jgi:anti-sigma factor RsiW
MKPEILERLLIDRALGALAPDVAALLEEHLEKEPQQEATGREISDTVRLAKLSLGRRRQVPLPPLKWVPLALAENAAPRAAYRYARQLAQVAAAFVLGIGLAFWMFPRTDRAVPRAMADRLMAEAKGADTASSLWSLKRLGSVAPRAGLPAQRRLTWRSLEQIQSQLD